MKKQYLFAALLLLFALAATAQPKPKQKIGDVDAIVNRIPSNQKNKDDNNKSKGNSTFDDNESRRETTQSKKVSDSPYHSEYYKKIVNQRGLWKGVGKPLTTEQRKHIATYYKLMRPNDAPASSPFTQMQIVNNKGELSTDLGYSYIYSSDGLLSEWGDKINEICQAEKIIHNGILVQENMFDQEGKLIIQFIPTFVTNDSIVGHFVGPDGRMPKLRRGERNTYISIKLDAKGFYSKTAFYDEDGKLVKNGDGAYTELRTFDTDGNTIISMSGDAKGLPMIDDWGNCGWIYSYDSQGNTLTASCIDDKGNPMRMPTKKAEASGVWRTQYTYDKWGNKTSQSHFDNNGHPDANAQGIHRTLYTYNDAGKYLSIRNEDVNHQLTDNSSGWATQERDYDKDGNLIFYCFKNKNGHYPSSSPDFISVSHKRYNKGEITFDERFYSTDGTDLKPALIAHYYPDIDSVWKYTEDYMIVRNYSHTPEGEKYNSKSTYIFLDNLGYTGRTSNGSGLYYKLVINKDENGNMVSREALSEFDEPSYAQFGDKESSSFFCFEKNDDDYDENNEPLEYYSTTRRKLHKSYYIEALTSEALKNGLQTGDLIVRYGDWYYPKTETRDHMMELNYELVRKASTSKTIVVMRHDSKTKTSQLIPLELPKGTPDQLGFICHLVYLTKQEAQRYNNTMSTSPMVKDYSLTKNDTDNDEGQEYRVYFFIPNKAGNSKRKTFFNNGFHDNVIALAWETFVDGQSYFFNYDDPWFDQDAPFCKDFDSIALYYTADGIHTQRQVFSKWAFESNNARYTSIIVNDGANIQRMCDSLQLAHAHAPIANLAPMKLSEATKTLLQLNCSKKTKELDDCTRTDIRIAKTEMSYDEMLQAHHILTHLDMSDYFYIYEGLGNHSANSYVKVKDDKVSEIVCNGESYLIINTANDNKDISNKSFPHKLPIVTANEEGFYNGIKLEPNQSYVVMQYDQWQLGSLFSPDLISPNDDHSITLAPIQENEDDKKPLGRVKKASFTGALTLDYKTIQEVSSTVFIEAVKKAKNLK